jgi:hypothetical protein
MSTKFNKKYLLYNNQEIVLLKITVLGKTKKEKGKELRNKESEMKKNCTILDKKQIQDKKCHQKMCLENCYKMKLCMYIQGDFES